MLVKKASDIRSSEITDKKLYLAPARIHPGRGVDHRGRCRRGAGDRARPRRSRGRA